MKIFYKIIAILCITVAIGGCSRKKDNFVSRNYHSVTAKYNTLYNGFNALEEGRTSLNTSYQDNYWQLLPIERMQVSEELMLPGASKNENFTRAEEKAVKAVQKHGMNISGKEKNPQIDEAYLLLGKSRYFDQRFVPALEAFNYILYKYPASDKINQAKVWREKTNIRLENEELAIKNLKRLLEQEELKDQDLADASSMLAQAYINTKAIDSALVQMKVAAKATKKNDEKGRYYFILGQLYNKLSYKDSANLAFDEVIKLNRKTPRIYMLSAEVEKAKNFDYEKGDKEKLVKHLTKLAKNRENKPYLDKIYFQTAEFYKTNKQDSLAEVFYNKSLKTYSPDRILVAKNYEILGDMYFDNSNYALAGKYYDSTMQKMVENTKPYRIIKRKRENLDDVIYFEGLAKRNDSIRNLIALSEQERLTYFTKYTDKLKAEAKAEKERLEIQERMKGLAQNNKTGGFNIGAKNNDAGKFYFYNPTTVAYGKNEFSKIWGDRALEDNWRWSSNTGAGDKTTALSQSDLELASATEAELFDPQFYISKIPTKNKSIDSINKERNLAYYKLGLIYKEKFRAYNLSKNKFTNLLESNPEERFILPSKYNLYKIYEILGDANAANTVKTDIVTTYPESRYALLLKHPELAASKDESSPESIYEKTYKAFENQEYETVIETCKKNINALEGDPIVPKFDLLKARASGRLYGYDAYKKGLEQVAVNYANTPEGEKAQNEINNTLIALENKTFVPVADSKKFKVLFTFANNSSEITTFKNTLDTVIGKINHYRLKTSTDVYSPDTTFVVVHGLKSIEGAKGFNEMLLYDDREKVNKPFIPISSDNYKIIQIHKNLESYLDNL